MSDGSELRRVERELQRYKKENTAARELLEAVHKQGLLNFELDDVGAKWKHAIGEIAKISTSFSTLYMRPLRASPWV